MTLSRCYKPSHSPVHVPQVPTQRGVPGHGVLAGTLPLPPQPLRRQGSQEKGRTVSTQGPLAARAVQGPLAVRPRQSRRRLRVLPLTMSVLSVQCLCLTFESGHALGSSLVDIHV